MAIESVRKAIENLITQRIYLLNTCMPGIVEKQDGPYRVQVTPAINYKYSDGSVLEHRPIANVPIMYQRTNKAAIRLPKLVRGDTGLLLFSQRALDTWLMSQTGDKNTAQDPRRFDLTDAIFIPGLYPFAIDTPEAESLDNLELIFNDSSVIIKPNGDIKMNNGNCTIEMTSTQVKINGDNLTVSK